jgi:hypothetical protein
MAIHRHNDDVISTPFSPVDAFFFVRLTIGGNQAILQSPQKSTVGGTLFGNVV